MPYLFICFLFVSCIFNSLLPTFTCMQLDWLYTVLYYEYYSCSHQTSYAQSSINVSIILLMRFTFTKHSLHGTCCCVVIGREFLSFSFFLFCTFTIFLTHCHVKTIWNTLIDKLHKDLLNRSSPVLVQACDLLYLRINRFLNAITMLDTRITKQKIR